MAEGQHHHVTHAASGHTQANSHSRAHSSRREAILGQRRERAIVSPLGINPVGPANHLGTTLQEDGFT